MTKQNLVIWVQYLLALAAVLSASGCERIARKLDEINSPDPVSRIFIRCNQDTHRLQTYIVYFNDRGVPGTTQYAVDGQLNKTPCSVSTENQNRPFTESEAVGAGFVPPLRIDARRSTPNKADTRTSSTPAANPATSLMDQFAILAPSLFEPLFPGTDSSRLPVNCPPGRQGYLVNHLQNTVTAFGICPMQLLKEISVASNPLQVAITPDGSTALVTSFDYALTFIDTATNRVTATLDLVNYTPSGIAIAPDGKLAYLTNYDNSAPLLVVVDIGARKVVSTIKLPYIYPRVVMLTPDGSQAWVNYYTGGIVSVVDLLTRTVAGTVSIGQLVDTGMAFNPAGTKAFIAVFPNWIYVVETSTLAITAKIPVGQAPSDVAFTIDGWRVLVTSEVEPGTWWIDPRTNTLMGQSVAAGDSGGSMGLLIVQ